MATTNLNGNIDVTVVRNDLHDGNTGIKGSAKHTVALSGKDGPKIALTGALVRGADGLVGTEELCDMVASQELDEVKVTDKTIMRDGVSTITSAKKYVRTDLIALLRKSAGLTPAPTGTANGKASKTAQRANAAPATSGSTNGSPTP